MQQTRSNPSMILLLCLIIGTGFSNAQYISAIYITPARTTVEAGASHTLECVVTGDQSTPLFSWFLEDQAIDNTDSRFLVSSGELEIQAFSPALEGAYRCTAENSVGKIVSFSLSLKLAYFSVDRSSLPGSIPIVSPNSSFSLSCPLYAVTSHPPPSVSWWYESGQIQDHYPLVVSLDYELVFSLIRQSDTGIYACRTTNSFLNVSEKFDVAAVTMPSDQTLSKVRSFYISPTNRTAALGDDVSFQCVITGSSSSQPALWKFGDTSLFESDRISLTQSSGILTIRNVTLRDMGSYSCIDADNQQDSRLFTLTVIIPPTVISNQSLYQPIQGSTLSLSCESVGTAPVEYSWYYNGNPLGSSYWEIELRSVSAADTGLYQCYVENSAGRDMRVFTLNVKGFEPELTFLQRDILAFEGSAFVFGFVAYGAPVPIYTYSHNNHTLQSTDYSTLNETHYSVAAANSTHSGLYTCTISNTAGFIEYSFSILVVEPTQPYSSMADTLTALLDSSVSIACRATADANYATLTLSYRWERDGTSVTVSAGRFQIIGSFGDLEITQVESTDAGSYACIALTADSSLMYESQLETLIGYTDIRIATVPDPPVSVGAVLTGESSLEVSWSPPLNNGGVGVSRYLVEYKFDSFAGWINAGESPLLVYNVTYYCPSFEYVFRVSAVNAVGSSVSSLASVPIQVPAEIPSVSPANLTVSSTPTPTHISLTWLIPDSNTLCSVLNGNLLDHYIQYISTSPLSTQHILTGSSQLNYTLTGLAQSTYYNIRVAFKNSVGIGEFSDNVSAVTFYDSPFNPPAIFEVESFGIGRIAVYFTAPLDNAIITGYKVRCQPEIGDVLSYFLSHDRASTVTVISDGVVDGTIYSCNILAINTIGDGPPTEIKTVIASKRQVPNIPEYLYILPNGSYGAIFTWTAPNDTTDFLLTLEYRYSLTPHILRQSAFEVASPLSTHAISSLDAGVTYSVKFAGRNTDGIGFNLTSLFDLPPGRPRSPTLTLSESSTGDNATLTWSISHNGGSEITSIIVQRKIRDSTWFTVATIYEYNTTSYGLNIADKGFQFRILIQNYFGSASSTPVLFEFSIGRDVSPLILIVIAVALATVLALTCFLFICLFVYFSYWRQHRKSRFLDVRGSTEQSAEEESRIFRNLNSAPIDDKKTEIFPAQQSETSSDCTDIPPSYHSNYPSKDSKASTKSNSSLRRKVELTEHKRQGPVKKGVLSQPGKIQSAKLPHKKVVFSEQRGQSSIDSDSTEPSQVSWTNTFNRHLRDSPTPINLEEFTPTLPSRVHVEKQSHPLNLTTNSFSNILPGRNSNAWDFKYEQNEAPVHLISHKKSKSDELSGHYSTVQGILPSQHPALKKFKGSSGKLNPDVRNEAKARSKSPISFITEKYSPTKLKESELPNPEANVPPLPDFPNPAFDESALSNTVFSFDQFSSRIPSQPGYEHQHTDSTQSQQVSSLSSNC